MSDKEIEREIQAKGLTAPRVTPADIAANIASEHYFTAGDGAARTTAVNIPRNRPDPVTASLVDSLRPRPEKRLHRSGIVRLR